MKIDEEGHIIPSKNFRRTRNIQENKELQSLLKQHRSILKSNDGEKRDRKKTKFASTLDLVQDLEEPLRSKSNFRLPRINEHLPAAKEMLHENLPGIV